MPPPTPIILSDLGGTPSQGGDMNLNAPSYYDVNIGGITDGTAQVCIVSTSSTLMDYWDGSSWVSASNVQNYGGLVGFHYVCGNILASALTATAIGIGTPNSPTNGVPQFPLGMGLMLVLATFGLLILRRGIVRSPLKL